MDRTLAVATASVLFVVATTFAKDPAPSALDDARALAARGDAPGAATRFGDALAAAHAAGDMQAEQEAADALQEFLDQRRIENITRRARASTPGEGAESDAAAYAWLLDAVMKKLDAKRCGAFVSAPVLARNMLLLATESGDLSLAADAAKVLAVHAGKPASGHAAGVVAKYAEGMKAAANSKPDQAAPLLDRAATEAQAAGWTDLALHATTEAAAAWHRAGDDVKAAASVAAGATTLGATPNPNRVNMWNAYAMKRLADAPDTVRKPLADLVAQAKGPNSVSAAGGRPGAGAPGGAEPVSDIGKLLPKLGKGKPVVSVKRVADGMQVRWITAMDDKDVRRFEDSVRIADAGGVTVALFDRSAALMMVDLKGTRGQPGEGSDPGIARAFYLLAEGETWSVTKDGVVTITR